MRRTGVLWVRSLGQMHLGILGTLGVLGVWFGGRVPPIVLKVLGPFSTTAITKPNQPQNLWVVLQ